MAASWLRINEIFRSSAENVCIVACIQSINKVQRTIILFENDKDAHNSNNTKPTSSTVNVSLDNLRTPIDIQSSYLSIGQFIQVYGKVIRSNSSTIRIDAQYIRNLGTNFDKAKYVIGLNLIRDYITNLNSNYDSENANLVDNCGNPIRSIL